LEEQKLKITLITHTPEPEKVVAAAAKLCYSSKADISSLMDSLDDPETVRKFIEKLMEMHHYSPLEHVSFTFGIEDVSRSFLAQITRHRLAAFSVRSQRYCSEDMSAPVVPASIMQDTAKAEEFRIAMESAWSSYRQLIEMGVPKEDARAVLPNACSTRMIVTMNARELLHFFSLRCCSRAQLEIRQAAWKMLEECKKVAPTIFAHGGAACDQTGECPEGARSCGRNGKGKK
jgi:thymidylate synthase (FAD)